MCVRVGRRGGGFCDGEDEGMGSWIMDLDGAFRIGLYGIEK